ncbi:MAG: hypothetical protein ABIT76_07385 [Chthoniobacterales bacterium]
MIFTTAKEIQTVSFGRPHVVILGAGASRAAFPNGDRYGTKLPVMKDFVDVLGLRGELLKAGVSEDFDNFELLFTKVALDPSLSELMVYVETTISNYFSSLELPDTPTIYDHLVLSLRPKDFIATFNWDPFLWNACARNYTFSTPPTILFLHGCVATAHCPKCKIVTTRFLHCKKCGSTLIPSPLLYPIQNKDYTLDPAIAAHWRTLDHALKNAWTLTIFGYGAPHTDVEAIRLMKSAWGNVAERELEETEIIDVRSEKELVDTWSPFIHTHHYRTALDFYDSLLAKHPRRTCEALWACLMDCQFLDQIDFPKAADFPELYSYLLPRLEAENKKSGTQ